MNDKNHIIDLIKEIQNCPKNTSTNSSPMKNTYSYSGMARIYSQNPTRKSLSTSLILNLSSN
ncbi:MAG: hypothetical protein IPQ18_05890 [Saprospiraceae bacterium]|nr:hypothetical protein [Saprospiraceae bacterium]